MKKRTRKHIEILERRKHHLERRLKTNGLLYTGRDFDRAEVAALEEAIELMEGE